MCFYTIFDVAVAIFWKALKCMTVLYIWADKRSGDDLYTYLRRQRKKYDKRRNGKSTRGQIWNRVCIDDRTKVVDDKLRVGDWEIDTVIGKGHRGALVTIVERVTNYT